MKFLSTFFFLFGGIENGSQPLSSTCFPLFSPLIVFLYFLLLSNSGTSKLFCTSSFIQQSPDVSLKMLIMVCGHGKATKPSSLDKDHASFFFNLLCLHKDGERAYWDFIKSVEPNDCD